MDEALHSCGEEGEGLTMPKAYYTVRYAWREKNGERREARTVVTHLSQLEAEAQFQRQNPHVRVLLTPAVVMPEAVNAEVAHAS